MFVRVMLMLMLVLVLSGGVSFFFQFLERCIQFEFFHVIRQVGLVFFDLFLFDCAAGRRVGRVLRLRGYVSPIAIDVVSFPVVRCVVVRLGAVLVFRFFFGLLAAKHRRNIHLVQTPLLTVPIGGI